MRSVVGRVKEFFRVLSEARHIMPALKFKMPDHQEQISIVSVFEDVVAQHPDRWWHSRPAIYRSLGR